jgi:general stress protein 26
MDFKEIFECFADCKKTLKTISVASSDLHGKPNSAAKMLVDIVEPNRIYYLDYRNTQTFTNLKENPQLSISFMNDAAFTGYRLTGTAEIIESGPEMEAAKKSWDRRVISYEADRILARVTGRYSTKESEMMLPPDFVIIKFTAREAAVIKPDRVFRAKR